MNTPVIDFHAHLGQQDKTGMTDEPSKMIAMMDAAGIDITCINCIFHGDMRKCNDLIHERVSLYPDRFVGFAYVTPNYIEEALPELERAFNTLNMKALKIYPPYVDGTITHPKWTPIFNWANDRGIVIMSHTSHGAPVDEGCGPGLFVDLAKKFSNVTWVLAHSGNMEQGRIQAVEAARECENIYLETCSSYGDHGAIEFLVNGAGPDRVLYGSDLPLMDPRFQLGRIATANIPSESKQQVLGLNAIKLLNLDVPANTDTIT
jgi:predicted TIM-barrel fold metal-dependent hydrolase